MVSVASRGQAYGLLLSLLTAGCATAPVSLNDKFAPSTRYSYERLDAANKAVTRNRCQIYLAKISDIRHDPNIMGNVGLRVVRSPANVVSWVRSAFMSLQTNDVEVLVAPIAATDALTMDVELVKAWAGSINTSISTTLVFKVSYRRGDVILRQIYYRGSDTSSNWSSSEREIQSNFDTAMQQALDYARLDVIALCEAIPIKNS